MGRGPLFFGYRNKCYFYILTIKFSAVMPCCGQGQRSAKKKGTKSTIVEHAGIKAAKQNKQAIQLSNQIAMQTAQRMKANPNNYQNRFM